MDSIDGAEFDLIIVGTGLSQSLLALYSMFNPIASGTHLTDQANAQVLYPEAGRRSSILTATLSTAAQMRRSACKMPATGAKKFTVDVNTTCA